MAEAPAIAYLFTTFPKSTETFLQREIAGLQAHGARLRIYSLWGGGGTFNGTPVTNFPKWKLVALGWMIPLTALRHPRLMCALLRDAFRRPPPSWLNFLENLLGAGFACLQAAEFRRDPPTHFHAAWSGAPATAAWILSRLNGQPYSTGAHAYDIYENGGDWWLREKLLSARFIHTSTAMAKQTLIDRGIPAGRIHIIRRGLNVLPPSRPLRPGRSPMRILCVARLVPKKGLGLQLQIYTAMRAAGIGFEARIAGGGPLHAKLAREIVNLDLGHCVQLCGPLPETKIWALMAWADVLVHTGVIAPGGDRDGLPNVIPEAMAAGAIVVTSPAAATTEAVTDGITGRVAPPSEPARWVEILETLATDDALAERLRAAARRWVEKNFDAKKNAAVLLDLHRGVDHQTTSS